MGANKPIRMLFTDWISSTRTPDIDDIRVNSKVGAETPLKEIIRVSSCTISGIPLNGTMTVSYKPCVCYYSESPEEFSVNVQAD